MSAELSSLAQAGRLWRTVRHLRVEQVTGRLRHRLVHPRPNCAAPPPLATVLPLWVRKAGRAPSLTGPRSFDFLGQGGCLDELGWTSDAKGLLWRYNQHYFDDLHAQGAVQRRAWHYALIADWILQNPPARGVGCAPYPLSLRLVNWAALHLGGDRLDDTAFASMAVQARFLMRRLERHLLGNHLFANGKALLFMGILFAGPEADRWRRQARAILMQQVPEQILTDGGHFERSTLYHALAVEDVLDLINLLRCRAPGQATDCDELLACLCARLPEMLRWLQSFCHPDGEIAFFNDAAIGIAPHPQRLLQYAERLGFTAPGPRPGLYQPSGYARLQAGPAVLLADVGPVGPDYLPGHVHADTLSFEFSLHAQRLIVNSGTSVYGDDPVERQRQRATAAHSTLVYDATSSTETWATFRTGRRARPLDVALNGTTLTAAHDGYRHLAGRPVHRRTWNLTGDGLTVTDAVEGGSAPAKVLFFLAPEVAATRHGEVIHLTLGAVQAELTCDGGALRLMPSTWHPRFGRSVPR